MPYIQEHVARVADYAGTTGYNRQENAVTGIDLITAMSGGQPVILEYRFKKNKFTAEQAQAWLDKRLILVKEFTPAVDDVKLATKDFAEDCPIFKAKELYKTRKDIFSAGTWNGFTYGESDLDEMVENFNYLKESNPDFKKGVPFKVDLFKNVKPEDLRHGGEPACGWITKVVREGKKIFADIEDIPRVVKELIETRAYKQVSAEIWPKRRDAAKGVLNNVLKGVALLGVEHPGVKNLDEFLALYTDQPAEEVRAHIVEEVTKNHKEDEHMAMTEQEKQELEAAKAAQAKAEKEAKEFKEKLDAEEKARKEASDKAAVEAQKQREADIKTFIEAQKKEGRILPAHEKTVEFVMNNIDVTKVVKFTDKEGKESDISALDSFKIYIESLPKLVDFKEKGAGDEHPETFQAKPEETHGSKESQELDFKAKKYMETHKDVGYADALIAVSTEQSQK